MPLRQRHPRAASTAHLTACSCLASAHEWYTEYARMVRRYLLTRVGDPQAADECLNETFLRAIARRNDFRCAGDGVRPWLFTIARNIAHDHAKKAWRHRETLVDHLATAATPRPRPNRPRCPRSCERSCTGASSSCPLISSGACGGGSSQGSPWSRPQS